MSGEFWFNLMMIVGFAAFLLVMLIPPCRGTPINLDQGEVNEDYDALINKLLDEDKITMEGTHRAKAEGLTIWIENYPYAYGHPYESGVSERMLPKLETRKRLKDEMTRQSVDAIKRLTQGSDQ